MLLEVVEGIEAAQPVNGDVVVLATKSQDTEEALRHLEAASAADGIAVACAQNGVDNERMVSRRGFTAYGMSVTVPAVHLQPGLVECQFGPVAGVIDIGKYPSGIDPVAERMAADLVDAGFAARARLDIMRFKYAKLVGNVVSALEAACGQAARGSDLALAAQAEARACYAAAGLDVAIDDEMSEAMAALNAPTNISVPSDTGGSSWQSLRRGTGRIEADWLNGEIVLLGKLHGVETPVNEGLRRLANRMAQEALTPASFSLADVELELKSQPARSR